MSGGFLDWANQPRPFKTFPEADRIALPWPPETRSATMADVLDKRPDPAPLSPAGLATLLYLSNGPTATARHGEEEFYYRAAASAGALYPTEVYAVLGDLDAAPAGLYHWPVIDMTLSRLRREDYRGYVVEKMLGLDYARAGYLVMTAIFWRSAWKYRDRAWRYCLLDTGHVLGAALWGARYVGMVTRTFFSFDDRAAAELLGCDPGLEGPLVIVGLGQQSPIGEGPAPDLTATKVPDSKPLSGSSKLFGPIQQAYEASFLGGPPFDRVPVTAEPIDSDRAAGRALPTCDLAADYMETVMARRSRRNFVRRSCEAGDMGSLLEAATLSFGGDIYDDDDSGLGLADVYVVAGAVDGVDPGVYQYRPGDEALEVVQGGDVRRDLARAGLGQAWMGQAAFSLVLAADLARLERERGPRAYREAMIEAGVIGQRTYLAATALGMGCCGVGAFYDTEVAHVIGRPDLDPMYVLCVGPVKGGVEL